MNVLIWTKHIELKNVGGPSGYLYNVKQFLDENHCENIDFYPDEYVMPSKNIPKRGFKLKFRNFVKWLSSPYRFFKCLRTNYFKKIPLTKSDLALISKYDYVHVHYLCHMLQSFMSFENQHTKIILTTHNPEPLIDQLAGEYNSTWMLKLSFVRNYFIKKEISAYERADKIMFPVAEAREPYENRSRLFFNAFRQFEKENKFFYVPTSLGSSDPCLENKHVLDKYNIPSNAVKLCYVGRHNFVKGYDSIQRMARIIWKENPNVYFVIGGKEGPLYGLSDQRWIELGWVHTQSLLNEVDAFILPNKDTYFDLILLEVLRQGTPVILTRTGGNKWFEKKNFDGMFFYERDDLDVAVQCVKNLIVQKNCGKIDGVMQNIRKKFHDTLSMSMYVNSYLSQLGA